ncbi:MAG: M56 family metallopeptidase [Actinomycetota bacterium]|nr:M56 family metallopeptidase [Actinomycetota bacterium]
MNSTPPVILALQPEAASVVVVVVSVVTLALVLVIRRLIQRPGGFASGLLLALPLALPIVAALLFSRFMLPEVTVLRPVMSSFARVGDGLGQLVLVRGGRGNTLIPYALAGSTPWLLLIGGAVAFLTVLRRAAGIYTMKRLLRRCVPLGDFGRPDIVATVARLAYAFELRAAPEVLVFSGGAHGAYAMAGNGGRILLSDCVLTILDDQELEATIAHEMAHLKASDVRLVAVAGFLRDLVAWNPIAHIALRRLELDRELEADRRAADITGRPLAVASSLLKMCSLSRSKGLRVSTALGFWTGRGRVQRRVTNMLAVAEGRAVTGSSTTLPFLAAAALAAALALQVGGTIAEGDGAAFAVAWGGSSSEEMRVWTPEADPRNAKRITAPAGGGRAGSPAARRRLRTQRDLELLRSAPAVAAKNLPKWIRAMTRVARNRGITSTAPGLSTATGWEVQPLISDQPIGLGVYRIERLSLPPKMLQPQGS